MKYWHTFIALNSVAEISNSKFKSMRAFRTGVSRTRKRSIIANKLFQRVLVSSIKVRSLWGLSAMVYFYSVSVFKGEILKTLIIFRIFANVSLTLMVIISPPWHSTGTSSNIGSEPSPSSKLKLPSSSKYSSISRSSYTWLDPSLSSLLWAISNWIPDFLYRMSHTARWRVWA